MSQGINHNQESFIYSADSYGVPDNWQALLYSPQKHFCELQIWSALSWSIESNGIRYRKNKQIVMVLEGKE